MLGNFHCIYDHQVPNSMPRPQLMLCPHRHMDILKAAELLYYYVNEIPYNQSNDPFKDENKTKTFTTTLGVMGSLSKVYNMLENIPKNASEHVKRKLTEWNKIKEDLMSESVLISLTDNFDYFTTYKIQRVLVMFCEKEGLKCPDFTYRLLGRNDNYQACIRFDMLMDQVFDEATSQGIRNGLTVIALSENTFFDKAFNFQSKTPVPGMKNFLSMIGGRRGIRLLVDGPKIVKDPKMYGLDLPPGTSATIGVTAKKIHHLRHPYTNCSEVDYEQKLLVETIQKKYPDVEQGVGLIENTYAPWYCRYVFLAHLCNWRDGLICITFQGALLLVGVRVCYRQKGCAFGNLCARKGMVFKLCHKG